jgi:hypothetical protein
MLRFSIILGLAIPIPIAMWLATTAAATGFNAGDTGFLCLKQELTNWPEKFAVKVRVIGLKRGRYKVEVIDTFKPATGRTNEENTLATGDVITVSPRSLFSRDHAGVRPGRRFEGKPVCAGLMKPG